MPKAAHDTAPHDFHPCFTLATYNIHQCIGVDRRRDPRRVLRVLREIRADVIGLQEVYSEEGPFPELAQLEYLAHGCGLTPLAGPTMLRGNGNYGNALLTNFPVMEDHLVDLTVPGREPRGAIDAVLRVNRRSVRVLVTHLGLRARERRTQAEKLLELLQDSRGKPPIVLADMNEWFPLGGSLRRFSQCLGKLPAPGTFPSRFPIFSLDRIWMGQGVRLEKMRVHRTPISRIASDHLPITARVRLEAPSGEAKQK